MSSIEWGSLTRPVYDQVVEDLFLAENADIPEDAVAADLVVIQDATSRYFPYPEKVEFADRVYVRCLRLLLEGECVVMPGQREVTPKLNGNDSSTVRQLLSGEYMSLIIEMENYGQELMGHDVYVGPGRVYAPQIAAVDAPGALAALDADEAEGLPVTLRARDGYGFWVFLPDRHKGPADGRLRPVGLGLPDFADDPDVARALIATDNVDDPT